MVLLLKSDVMHIYTGKELYVEIWDDQSIKVIWLEKLKGSFFTCHGRNFNQLAIKIKIKNDFQLYMDGQAGQIYKDIWDNSLNAEKSLKHISESKPKIRLGSNTKKLLLYKCKFKIDLSFT